MNPHEAASKTLQSARRAACLPRPGARAALVAFVLLGACSRPRDTSAKRGDGDAAAGAAAGASSVDVAFSGCARVRTGPVCELEPSRSLRLFVRKAGAANAEYRAGDAPVTPTLVVPFDDGFQVTLTIPETARAVSVGLSQGDSRPSSFRVESVAVPVWYQEAKTLRRDGKLDAAAALAHTASQSAVADAGDGDRVRGLGLEARIALTKGAFDDAERLFRQSIPLARSAGYVSDATDDALALAFMLSDRLHRIADAQVVLDGAAKDAVAFPDGQARLAYYRSRLTRAVGDSRATLAALDEATARGERLGIASLVRNSLESTAMQLGRVGRHDEAVAQLLRIEASDRQKAAPCDRLTLTNNIAVEELRLSSRNGDASPATMADPLARLAEASTLAASSCPDAYRKASVLTELALALVRAGRVSDAAARLADAHAAVAEPRGELAPFLLEVEGRVALAQKRVAAAVALFTRAQKLAEVSLQRYAAWSATLWRATALEELAPASAHRNEALAAYADAEERLAEASFLVPLGEGRGSFLAEREVGARSRIDLLLRAGDSRGAMAAARASVMRVVATLASAEQLASLSPERRARFQGAVDAYARERAAIEETASHDWELSVADLDRAQAARGGALARSRASLDTALTALRGQEAKYEPPVRAQGTALVVYHPIRDGWVGLLEDDDGVVAARIGAFPPAAAPTSPTAPSEALAKALLEPFRAALAKASRVRFLPYGAAREVDFHALPFNGAPLVFALPVEYGIDARRAAEAPSPKGTSMTAVVVADARGDLASARSDGAAVADALTKAGVHVSALADREATPAAVGRALNPNGNANANATDLFFFAGHGTHAGRDGVDSALLLADTAVMTASDVLARPEPPHHVVLAACETAAHERTTSAAGLGVAQAFLVAGSRSVIAPTRPLRDADVGALSRDLVSGVTPGSPWDAASFLRNAQMRASRATPTIDWSAFRALVQ